MLAYPMQEPGYIEIQTPRKVIQQMPEVLKSNIIHPVPFILIIKKEYLLSCSIFINIKVAFDWTSHRKYDEQKKLKI